MAPTENGPTRLPEWAKDGAEVPPPDLMSDPEMLDLHRRAMDGLCRAADEAEAEELNPIFRKAA